MITGFMTLGGVTVGALANSAEQTLSTAGCRKAEKFIYFCDAFGIPMITLTNVKKYASSMEEEKDHRTGCSRSDLCFCQRRECESECNYRWKLTEVPM